MVANQTVIGVVRGLELLTTKPLREQLEDEGIEVFDPEYVADQKRMVLRQAHPKIIGGAWRIPLAANNIVLAISFFAPLVAGPVAFCSWWGSSVLAHIGLGIGGLCAGLVAGCLLTIAMLVPTDWLLDVAQRASTRWERVPAGTHNLPDGPRAIMEATKERLPGQPLEFMVDRPTAQNLDPFLVAVIQHEDGQPEECYIAQWE